MTASETDQTLKLVSMAYGVAIQPDRFDDLLIAWDAWFEDNILDAEGAFDKLAASFEEAVSASERPDGQAPQKSATDHSPSPGILLDKSGAVLGVNSAAGALLAAEGCDAEALLATAQKSDFVLGKRNWAPTGLVGDSKAARIWRWKRLLAKRSSGNILRRTRYFCCR